MKNPRIIGIISLLAILFNFDGLQAELPERFAQSWQDVEAEYHKGLKQYSIVGSSLMFMEKGKIIGQSFFGFADLESQRTIDEHTIYHWASITKTFTAIAIMQLRDKNLLSLNDPIVNYIPELNQVYNPYGEMSEITLKHLLTHSSGFRNSTWPWGGDLDWHPHEPKSWQQIVAMLPYTEIQFKPGSQHSYSNPGIIFLGRVIEQISGDDYEVYIDKNVLKDVSM